MKLKACDFNRLITIEYKVVTQDQDYGTEIINWTPLSALPGSPVVAEKFPAQVLDVLPSRAESVQNGLEISRNQTRIRMRYRNDVTSAMRVTVHGDTDVIYQIIGGPAMIGRKEGLELLCEKYSS